MYCLSLPLSRTLRKVDLRRIGFDGKVLKDLKRQKESIKLTTNINNNKDLVTDNNCGRYSDIGSRTTKRSRINLALISSSLLESSYPEKGLRREQISGGGASFDAKNLPRNKIISCLLKAKFEKIMVVGGPGKYV